MPCCRCATVNCGCWRLQSLPITVGRVAHVTLFLQMVQRWRRRRGSWARRRGRSGVRRRRHLKVVGAILNCDLPILNCVLLLAHWQIVIRPSQAALARGFHRCISYNPEGSDEGAWAFLPNWIAVVEGATSAHVPSEGATSSALVICLEVADGNDERPIAVLLE